MTTGKTIALTRRTFVDKVMSLLFNMLSRLVITVLPRSKRLFISWLQLPSAVILEPKKIKSLTVSIVSPSICHEVMGPDAMILVFWMLDFKPTFSLSSFTFINRFLKEPLRFAIGLCHLYIWGYWYFSQQSYSLLHFIFHFYPSKHLHSFIPRPSWLHTLTVPPQYLPFHNTGLISSPGPPLQEILALLDPVSQSILTDYKLAENHTWYLFKIHSWPVFLMRLRVTQWMLVV